MEHQRTGGLLCLGVSSVVALYAEHDGLPAPPPNPAAYVPSILNKYL